MECKGLVTKIDPYYGYFEVDNKYTVHLSILKSYTPNVKLPKVDSRVVAKKLHKTSLSSVACHTSILEGDFNVDIESNSFTNLVKTYKLGVADVIMITDTLKMFEKNFIFENEGLRDSVFTSLLERVVKLYLSTAEYNNHRCLNRIISHVEINSINSCKYVEIVSKNFEDFPPWSFGMHPKPKKDAVLFGFLYIDPQYGFLMFKDQLHKIVCIITNQNSNVDHLENSYILITNYKVVTEIYKESKVPNLEYLLTNFENIITIQAGKKNAELFGDISPNGFENVLEFIILRKSVICIGENRNPETYLQILVTKENETETNDNHFLTLPANYTTIVLHFKESFKYRLHHNVPLKEVVNLRLSSIAKLKNFEIAERDAYFQELEIVKDMACTKILMVEDCRGYMAKNSSLFTFEGVIRNRGFVKSFSPKPKRTSLYGFSTPGTETHTLVFGYKVNDCDSSVTLYLRDWINQLMPLGLIPQMRVRVKNVQPKSTYIKSTIFTSIEIVSYEPLVHFKSANLFENYEVDWGPPYFLSRGNDIPHGVIVWSKIFNVHILQVNMSNRCTSCDLLIEASGSCIHCGSKERNFKFYLVIHASDEYGLSKVIVKDPRFLRTILDLTEKQFSVWLEAFQAVGAYSFNIHDKDNHFDNMFDSNKFKNILSHFLITFNKSLFDGVELKGRKMFKNTKKKENTKCEYPEWFYIDSRRS